MSVDFGINKSLGLLRERESEGEIWGDMRRERDLCRFSFRNI